MKVEEQCSLSGLPLANTTYSFEQIKQSCQRAEKGGVEILDESLAAPVFSPSVWEHLEVLL